MHILWEFSCCTSHSISQSSWLCGYSSGSSESSLSSVFCHCPLCHGTDLELFLMQAGRISPTPLTSVDQNLKMMMSVPRNVLWWLSALSSLVGKALNFHALSSKKLPFQNQHYVVFLDNFYLQWCKITIYFLFDLLNQIKTVW